MDLSVMVNSYLCPLYQFFSIFVVPWTFFPNYLIIFIKQNTLPKS